MTQPLNEFISSIRFADTIEQERFLMSTEQAIIRAYIRKCDPAMRPRIVSKLVFLDILGQNVAWGQMEAITLMCHDRFSFKRVGYISAACLVDETTELSVLVTHTLLKDLQSTNPHIQCLALSFVANLASAEVGRSVASAVQKTLDSTHAGVLKRAGMAVVQIVRKNPDLAEIFKNSVQKLLNHSSHGVVNSGINMVISMIEVEPKLAKTWGQFVGPFTKILKTLSTSKGTKEYSYGNFADPYMQIKAMKALACLKKTTDELDGILQQIISSTEARRNAGRAILYQAVETIVHLSKNSSLRALAFNQVGRLLAMKDANVLYSALSVCARVLYAEREIINRTNTDSTALQRYKKHIVKCLDHQDPSIRRRALDVISALINETNVETLVPEILAFVRLADSEFRSELITKIYTATQRFAPSDKWYFDTVHQILISSGNYVSTEIITSFCDLISSNADLQKYAVRQLTDTLINFSDNQSLIQVSAYIIGEYAATSEAEDMFRKIITLPQTSIDSKLYIVMALAKLAMKAEDRSDTIALLNELSKSNSLELQQRSGELLRMLLNGNRCDFCLQGSQISEASETSTVLESTQSKSVDLLSLVMDDQPPSPSPTQPETPAPSQPASTSHQDLLSLIDDPKPAPQQPKAPKAQDGVITLVTRPDYLIRAQSQVNPNDPRQIAMKVAVTPLGNTELNDFKVEYMVSPGWQIQVKPPSTNVLPPAGGSPVLQVLYLFNQTPKAPFGMKIRTMYRYKSQPVVEEDTVPNIFA